MATLVKTPAGQWKALIRLTGWPTTSKTFSNRRDANDWARQVEQEMVRGVYIDRSPSERTTLNAAMARYLTEVSPTKSKGAAERERNTARPLLDELGAYSLAAITPQLVSDYRDKRLAGVSPKTGRPLSPNSVRLELALLSHLFTVAVQEWGVGLVRNPVAMIRKPRPAEARDRRLTPAEQARLLAQCRMHSNPMLYWIVVVAIETGMRRSEILGLRRRHVNLERRIVHLPQTKNGTARNVPLTRMATGVLQEAIDAPIRPDDTDLVFWGDARHGNGHRKPYDFTEAWERARDRAGLPDLRFHDLRHEAVSRLVEAGLGDQEVAAISGHKSMQMLKRYTHLRAEDLVEKLDRAFGGR
ncbi:MAG: site-specific integrase [Chromatiales bacterium]|nr:site-specific integrase [Chromatiales bacterium]